MSGSLFGQVRLGYVLVGSRKLDEWRRFGAEGLGLHVDRPDSRCVVFRIDDRQRRLIVTDSDAEDVLALGWELADQQALDLALARLGGLAATPRRLSSEECALRGVVEGWATTGPKRTALELFVKACGGGAPLQMRAAGFETGAAGMGHVAITSRSPEAMRRFYEQLFDARLSDFIADRASGVDVDITFLRVNERHHSIAIAATRKPRLDPLRTSIHHLNLQVGSFDDVVQGYRSCRALGYPIANAIGQHPNDRELSFYVDTPSGFAVELGWNPLVVTDADEGHWTPRTYQGISLWGHFTESAGLSLALRQFGRGLRSLMTHEYTPGAHP